MIKKKLGTLPLDQILFAIPAALFIATPLLDMFVNYFRAITGTQEYETFKVIPYLPVPITSILLLSLIIYYIWNWIKETKSKNLLKELNHRTYTFQTTLLIFIIYLGLVLMSIAVNGFTSYALHGHPYTKMSMWTYITNILLYLFVSSLVYDEQVKSFLVKLCCYGGGAYALYCVLASKIFRSSTKALHGTFHNSNHYGYYLAVSIALTSAMLINHLSTSFGKKGGNHSGSHSEGEEEEKAEADQSGEEKKQGMGDKIITLVIWTLVLGIQCVALAYNNTLGAWLAVLFTYIFLFIAYRVRDGKFNFWVLAPIGFFLIISIVSSLFTKSIFSSVIKTVTDVGEIATGAATADKAGSGRWKIWKATVRHIIDRPIFGNGIEGLLRIFAIEGVSTGSPHNEFLEYAAFFGVPAALAYTVGCVSVFIHGIKYRKELNAITLVCMAGGFAYLVSSFFGVCFYYTVVYPFIFLGLALNFTKRDRPVDNAAAPAAPADPIPQDETEETEEASEPSEPSTPTTPSTPTESDDPDNNQET